MKDSEKEGVRELRRLFDIVDPSAPVTLVTAMEGFFDFIETHGVAGGSVQVEAGAVKGDLEKLVPGSATSLFHMFQLGPKLRHGAALLDLNPCAFFLFEDGRGLVSILGPDGLRVSPFQSTADKQESVTNDV